MFAERDDDGGGENQPGQDQQEVDRPADRADQHACQQAAQNGAKRRAGSDETEQPLGLPGVEQRVREAPRLHGSDNPEAIHP